MQKKLVAPLLVAVLLAGCAGTVPRSADPVERGWISRDLLSTPSYAAFKTGYDTARVAPEFVGLIAKTRRDVDVTIFFGGWCSDSKREVPRFLKLADAAGIPKERIKLYALDRTKKSSDGLTEKYRIELVPTFIFLKDGEEIGRITETPRTTLEADVLTILAGAPGK
jgi:thiol-disulfide isomerase/thioredoxin